MKPTKGQYIDEDRTFFCSELVAKGYKILGLLDPNEEKPSNYYYPSSFSSKSNFLKLVKGVQLGQELNIVVDPKDIELIKSKTM